MNNSKSINVDRKTIIKSAWLLVFYWFSMYLGATFLGFFKSEFIDNNANTIIYTILFFAVLFVFKNYLLLSLKSIKTNFKKNFEFTVEMGFAFYYAFLISLIVLSIIFNLQNTNQDKIEIGYQNRILERIIVVTIMGPIIEELIYRVCIFKNIKNIYLAHIVTAVLFGFGHFAFEIIFCHQYSQLILIIPYMIMSLGFSITFQKTKNIMFPIMMHMAFNLIPTLSQLLKK